jgi:hypothetical protein
MFAPLSCKIKNINETKGYKVTFTPNHLALASKKHRIRKWDHEARVAAIKEVTSHPRSPTEVRTQKA